MFGAKRLTSTLMMEAVDSSITPIHTNDSRDISTPECTMLPQMSDTTHPVTRCHIPEEWRLQGLNNIVCYTQWD